MGDINAFRPSSAEWSPRIWVSHVGAPQVFKTIVYARQASMFSQSWLAEGFHHN